MSSITEKFYTMEYGAAPEDPKEAVSVARSAPSPL